MKRQLWGEFSTAQDESNLTKQNEIDQEIMDNKRGEKYLFNACCYKIYFFLISNNIF